MRMRMSLPRSMYNTIVSRFPLLCYYANLFVTFRLSPSRHHMTVFLCPFPYQRKLWAGLRRQGVYHSLYSATVSLSATSSLHSSLFSGCDRPSDETTAHARRGDKKRDLTNNMYHYISVDYYTLHVNGTKLLFHIMFGVPQQSSSHGNLLHLVFFVVARYISDSGPRFIQADICLGIKFVTWYKL